MYQFTGRTNEKNSRKNAQKGKHDYSTCVYGLMGCE